MKKVIALLALVVVIAQSCQSMHMYTARDNAGVMTHYFGHRPAGNVFIDDTTPMHNTMTVVCDCFK